MKMPCRHFSVYMEVLEVTPLKTRFVDFVIPACQISPWSLRSHPVHHSLTGLLVTVSLLPPYEFSHLIGEHIFILLIEVNPTSIEVNPT